MMGQVELPRSSHSWMARRSYVCPVSSVTGSSNTWLVIGHTKSLGVGRGPGVSSLPRAGELLLVYVRTSLLVKSPWDHQQLWRRRRLSYLAGSGDSRPASARRRGCLEDSGGAAIFSYKTRQVALATQIKPRPGLEACCQAWHWFDRVDFLVNARSWD